MGRKIPSIIYSKFCGFVSTKTTELEVFIVRLETSSLWTLEVLSADGALFTWTDQFFDDHEAYLEFQCCLSDGFFTQFPEGQVFGFEASNVVYLNQRGRGKIGAFTSD